MRHIPLALAGLIFATAAVAQTAPNPPGIAAPDAPGVAPPPPGPDAASPDAPPPRRGPGAPPPPPRGADIRYDRGPGTDLHLHVHCAESDTTTTCADITERLAGKLNVVVQAK